MFFSIWFPTTIILTPILLSEINFLVVFTPPPTIIGASVCFFISFNILIGTVFFAPLPASKNIIFLTHPFYASLEEHDSRTISHNDLQTAQLKEYNKLYWSKRMKEDELFRFKSIMRKSIGNLIKNKSKSTQDIIGCSFEEFKSYLESKFEYWMNWGNYGLFNGEYGYGWDIDHILPLSSVESEDDVVRLCHFSNLQPLCSRVNRYEKRNKIIFIW